jgi:hypothetical protein
MVANQFGINLPAIGQAWEAEEQNALRKMLTNKQIEAAKAEEIGRTALGGYAGGDMSQREAALKYNPKGVLDFEAAQRAARKAQMEEFQRGIPVLGRLFSNVADQNTYSEARAAAIRAGLLDDKDRLPEQFNPAIVGQINQAARALAEQKFEIKEGADGLYRVPVSGGAAQRVEGVTPKQTPIFQDQPLSGDKIQRVVSYDGGRSFQPFGAAYDRREPFVIQEVRLEDGSMQRIAIPRSAFSGGQAQAGGAASTVPGAPAGSVPIGQASEPKMTEGQANAALYATRMEEADQLIGKLGLAGTNIIAKGASQIPGVGNYLVPADYRRLEQAQRNFVNAVLRRESGAVINPDEFQNAAKQYFPQPGDDIATIEQKAANRRTAIQGIRNASGPAAKRTGSEAFTVQTPAGNVTIREVK